MLDHMKVTRMLEDLPKRLRAARERRNLTQDEVAKQLAVSRPLISQYESGKTVISVEHLLKLSIVLDTSFLELIGISARTGESLPPSVIEAMELMLDMSPDDREIVLRLIRGLSGQGKE